MSQEQAQASAGGSAEKTIPDVDVKTTGMYHAILFSLLTVKKLFEFFVFKKNY